MKQHIIPTRTAKIVKTDNTKHWQEGGALRLSNVADENKMTQFGEKF